MTFKFSVTQILYNTAPDTRVPSTIHMRYGSLMHYILQDNMLNSDILSFKKEEYFAKNPKYIKFNQHNELENLSNALSRDYLTESKNSLLNMIEFLQKNNAKIIDIELRINQFLFSKNNILTGMPDFIAYSNDKKMFYILDFKTDNYPLQNKKYAMQLGAYAMLYKNYKGADFSQFKSAIITKNKGVIYSYNNVETQTNYSSFLELAKKYVKAYGRS